MAAWDKDLDPAPTGKRPAWERDLDPVAAPQGASAQPLTRVEKLVKGVVDPISGGAQLLTNVLPQGVVQAGDRFNNWLADKTGLVARLPEGGVDQQVKQEEVTYQQRRKAAGEQGLDGYRLLGNLLSPANLAIATRVPLATTLGGRVLAGAGAGAASASLNPVVGEGDFAKEKGTQIGLGALLGGAVPVAANAVGRVISPRASVNPQLQTLRNEGVRPTVGQSLGGFFNRAEEKAISLPVVGDAIGRARRAASADLNRAAYNRALAPIQRQLPDDLTGREAVSFTEEAISRGYSNLLPSLTTRADPAFTTQVRNLQQMVNTGALDPNAARAFNRILQNDVLGKFQGQQAVTGQTLKAIESDLGAQIRRFAQSQDADQRLVGDALQEVQGALRSLLERSNPGRATELRALNTAWANFKRVQRATGALGAEEGVFSPAQLQSAVKALDRSKDKAAFARGDALMQDLSEAGKTILGDKVPNSGTADRLLLGGAPLAAFFSPTAAAGMAAAPILYSRPLQRLLAGAVGSRPQLAQPVANAVQQAAPGLVPAAAQMGLQLRNQ